MSAPVGGGPLRVLALWVPDWPVLAATTVAEVPPHLPAAVHDGHRLVAVSALARVQGVRRGMRRRHAREACPDLVLLAHDPGRDVRAFEPVVRAAEQVVAGVEVTRPGLLLLPEAGAGRYHGSTEVLAERLVSAVAETGHEAQAGVADGVGAAVLAARAGLVVPAGASTAFLAPLPLVELRHVADGAEVVAVTELVGLLTRLGLHTLGDLAALPADTITARFGTLGAWAHRVAAGRDNRPTALRRPEADLAVDLDLDPPAERVEAAAFAARRAAEKLHALLTDRGVGCGRLRITARTDGGVVLERAWRVEAALGGLGVGRVTDRVRWQLEGWLTAARRPRRPGGEEVPEPGALVHLALIAEEVVALGAEQGRLWGGHGGSDLRAHRALHRVQGLVGDTAVLGVGVQGGRDLRDQVRLVPWGHDAEPPRPDAPWPGRLPAPAPATVHTVPQPVEVLGADGVPVTVDARLRLSGEPARVRFEPWVESAGRSAGAAVFAAGADRSVAEAGGTVRAARGPGAVDPGGEVSDVVGWAGPWPVVQRWWGPDGTRRVYLQAALADGRAVLLALEGGRWTVEADYD